MESSLKFSYSTSSSSKNVHIRKKGKSRYELLFSEIDHLYIGFSPLRPQFIHKLINKIIKFRKKLPTFLSAKRFVHSSIFFATKQHDKDKDNYDGFLIEYGRYSKHFDDYKYKVFYPFKSGLRFTEMTLRDFKKKMNDLNEYANNLPYIKCKVNSYNSLKDLILKLIFKEKYDDPKNISFFYNVFTNRDENNEFMKIYNTKNYKLFKNNCQIFVAKMIEACYATIDPPITYLKNINSKEIFEINEIDYTELKYYIPPIIIESLERNNNIIEQRKKEGKSTIVETNINRLLDDINKDNLKNFDDSMSMNSISSIYN